MDTTDEEWAEDFGATPPSDAEVDEMIARARARGDIPLRQTLKYHLALRYISEQLLRSVENRETLAPTDALMKLSRFIVRGEGGIGSGPPEGRPWWKFW